jgi:hypothetical protein
MKPEFAQQLEIVADASLSSPSSSASAAALAIGSPAAWAAPRRSFTQKRVSQPFRAADALNDDGDAGLEALRKRRERTGNPASRARVAVSWVQLVYGRQLQQQQDEKPGGDVGSIDAAGRSRLIAESAEAEPELAAQLGIERGLFLRGLFG